MGACGSSKHSGEGNIVEHIPEDVDFEKVREEVRDRRDNNVYEVKADLWELIPINSKVIRKTLISRYLFFTPNGKFTSSVSKTMFSDLLIEGQLNSIT